MCEEKGFNGTALVAFLAGGLIGAGIALLALGLAFLYRFAVQRGLITPPLRVAFGLLLGTVLMALGTRLHALRERRAYALILLGGGLGILYLSAYAAFGFYALVDAQVALAALAGITLLSIRLAVHREQILLAQLGATGAYAAPLLVHTADPSATLLAGYLVLVAAWTGWTAVREGWRSLGWTTVGGAAWVLLLAQASPVSAGERSALIAAALLTGPVVVAALLVREVLVSRHPANWKRQPVGRLFSRLAPEELDVRSMAALAMATSVFFAAYTAAEAHAPIRVAGAIGLAEAAALGAVAWAWRSWPRHARALALAAAIPLLLGTLGLNTPEFRGLLVLDAVALLLVAKGTGDGALGALGHATFAFVGLAFASFVGNRLGQHIALPVLIADLVAVAGALYATSLVRRTDARNAYGIASLFGLLFWLLLALRPLPGGRYLATSSWGVVAATLLVVGWTREDARLRAGGLIAAAVLALKLVLVDTAELPAGGRIVVFLAFGVVFLALGALYRRRRAAS